MKKYIAPSIEIQNVDINEDILLTISREGEVDPSLPIDTKEEGDWNIWSDDEE